MRNLFLWFILICITTLTSLAQVPEKFNYQAVIRDNLGDPIINQSISVRITIKNNSASGSTLYRESHTVTSSNIGLVNLLIGDGDSDHGDFTDIDWGTSPKYLMIEINVGSDYSNSGTFQLLSVPYALYANEVANRDDADADPTNEIQDLELSGTELSITGGSTIDLGLIRDGVDDDDNDPLNEIQDLNLDGNVLTITNHPSPSPIDLSAYTGTNTDEQELSILGDTLYISNGNEVVLPYDSSKWVINGNTMYYNGGNVGIGSSTPVSNLEVKGTAITSNALFQVINSNNDTVFAVYPDGVKIFVNSESKGKVGGFAISGRSPSKAGNVEIFRATVDSTRIYVSDTVSAKGKVGGFAISGRSPSKGVGNDYLSITKDSTRIYVADADAGFGVENTSSGTNERLMRLTEDNYFIGHQAGGENSDGLYNTFLGYQSGIKHTTGNNNIYIGYQSAYNDSSGQNNIFLGNQTGYNNKNGSDNLFIGDSTGYNNTNGSGHVFLGHNAGASNTTGNNNSFVGYKSGQHNTSGDYNAFFGTYAGYSNTIGEYNAFFGSNAGYSVVGGSGEYNGSNNAFFGSYAGYNTTTGFCNVFIGPFAGYANTTGRENVFIGLMAGRENTTGFYNTFVGKSCGYYNTTGNLSTFVGFDAGLHNTIGYANTFFGASAGTFNTEGYNNTFIGAAAGYSNITGSGNVFIGYNAGKNEKGSNKLYIDNSDTATPLIYGNFTDGAEQVEIYGHFVVKQDFWVEGNAGGGTAWNSSSDKRLKMNITTLPNALNRVKQLRGVNFEWKDTTNQETGLQMGFIAQEALEIIPEVVEKNGEYYSMKYASITAILVEAVKEQQSLIENQNEKISKIEKENEELKTRLTNIEKLLLAK